MPTLSLIFESLGTKKINVKLFCFNCLEEIISLGEKLSSFHSCEILKRERVSAIFLDFHNLIKGFLTTYMIYDNTRAETDMVSKSMFCSF